MRSYKVNKDNKEQLPNKETIEKYKDFSRLSHEYERMTKRPKVPLYKDKKMFLVLLLIVLIAYLLSNYVGDEKGDESTEPTQTENASDDLQQIGD